MSGDVQPRKRKDKKRKKDSTSSDRSRIDAEFIARKLSLGDDSDEGVSIPVKSSSSHSSSQLGEGDSIIHVHHEGGTGGHWCAKIVFFFLLGILVFLIGLILIENRGLTDLDTPTESRYAQVFDGWVDEGPIHDDHHDEHTLELKHGDEDSHEDDDHDEEHDEEIEDIEDEHGDTEDEDEHTEDEGIGSDEEHADDDNDEDEADNDQDQVIEEDDDENNNDGGEDDDEDEGHNSNELDNDEDENDDDEDDVKKDSGENDEEENLHEIDYDGEGEDDDYLGASQENDDDDDDAEGEDSQLNDSREGDLDNAPFEEVDSMEEEVIENNAGEEEHLAAKKAEQLAQEQEDSGIGMRVGIGVALVVVAYCVLARKWQNVSPDVDDELLGDLNRRMTLISDEEVTDEVEKEVEEQIPVVKKNVSIVETAPTPSFFARPAKQIVHRYEEDEDEEIPPKEKIVEKKTITEEKLIQKPKEELPVQESAEKKDEQDEEEIDYEEDIEEVEEITREEIKNIETEYGDDGQDVEDEVEDDEILDEEIVDEELLDEEDIEDEDEEDEEEIDDDDDTDLMKKLEEKYGKLPEKISDDQPEGHSDDEVPVTPARKRGKPSGGNSVDDQEEWFDDTSDHWKQQLDLAQAEMDEGLFD